MKKMKKRKGFTLTELAIVIAVIAILIAVLVPTFVSLINKANESSDSQLAKNMNTLLANEEALGDKPERMEDVNQILVEGGYTIAKLTPSADNNIFVWNKETNRISYVSTEDWTVIYAGDTSLTTDGAFTPANNYWVTVESVDEIDNWSGLSYYISNEKGNFNNKTITLTNAASSVDTGTYTISAIKYTDGSSSSVENQTAKTKVGGNSTKATASISLTTAVVWGTVEELTVANSSISVINYASITKKTTVSKATAYTESGYSKELNVSSGASIEIAKDGMVATLSGTSSSITSSGYIGAIADGASLPTTITKSDTNSYSYTISNYSELISFRNKVNGGMTFEGLKVELTADIDISSKTWIPIGYDSRDTAKTQHEANSTLTYKYFAGTFNGNNHTISGLNNTGFTPTTVRTDTYGNKEGVSNYLYGFFGIINGATITKLNLTNVNIVEEGIVTDSVGAVAGVATGGVVITYCTASGSIEGTDAIGGILGRAYPANSNDKIDVENCTNNCTVTSKGDKAAGIVGFFDYTKINSATTKTIEIKNCTNTGAITAAKYVAGISVAENSCGFRSYTVTDCTNTGTLSVSDSESSCIGYIVGRGGIGTTFTISNSTKVYKWSISGCSSTFTTTASAAKVVWGDDGNQVSAS